jgi:cullin-4
MPKETSSQSRSSTGNAPDSAQKRKRIDKHPTVSDLLASQRSSIPHSQSSDDNSSISSKRQRLTPSSTPFIPVAPTSMYQFKSNRPPQRQTGAITVSHAVIDLTGSSPPPRALKVTRQPVISYPSKADTKVLQIRNLRTTKPNVQAFYDQTVQKLDKALGLILQGAQVPYSNEDLYRGVENLCRQGRARDLYERLTSILEKHASSVVKARLSGLVNLGTPGPEALDSILSEWHIWKDQSAFIRDIFYYLERTYLLAQSKKLDDTSKEIFNEHVLGNEVLGSKALDGVCKLISNAREGSKLDVQTSSDAVRMFTELGLYHNTLEPRILAESQSYFDAWATKHTSINGLADYVTSVLALFETEKARCDDIGLTTFTKRSTTESIELLAIKDQVERLSHEEELWELLDENEKISLEQLYSLLGRCQKSEALIVPFERWITDRGTKIVFDDKHEDSMVIKLLALKRQIDTLWIESFHRNKDFAQRLRSAFEAFMNATKKSEANYGTGNTKQGEMIAKYVNMVLEGGSKTIPTSLLNASSNVKAMEDDDNEVQDETEVINEQLDQVLDLFRFLHGKAVFEAFYKRDLARRLLLGRSASDDAELSMITRLKNECGSGFTQNIETMFRDMDLSKEEMTEYKSRQENAGLRSAVDLNVDVLSSAAWPSYPDIPFNVPKEVRNELTKFETSYSGAHTSRKLFWKYALHHTSLVAHFPRGKKELVVSAFQAAVLLMFNAPGDEPISYEAIQAQTGLRKLPRSHYSAIY